MSIFLKDLKKKKPVRGLVSPAGAKRQHHSEVQQPIRAACAINREAALQKTVVVCVIERL